MKKNNSNKINIITLGCSKNRVDSEVIMKQLLQGNYIVSHEDPKNDASIVIINTCGFIGDSKEESVEAIIDFAIMKSKGKIDKLFVFGCLAQRYKAELVQELPEVDGFFGFNETADMLSLLGVNFDNALVSQKNITTPLHYSYMKIAEGCDRKCSFCAIPQIRGSHISRPLEELLSEARYLHSCGVKELLLISQDLTYYGVDLYKRQSITELVKSISDLNLFEWIRLHYTFPASFPLDLLYLIKERQEICSYIDIPLQHINDKILRSMRRGAGKEETVKLVEKFREIVPDVAIRTSFIVGYPGETEEDFNELLDFIRQYRFDRVGAFTYSSEDGTFAGSLNDNIPLEVKQERYEILMDVQQDISLAKNREKIGKSFKVLIDSKDGGFYIGRTEYDSPEVDNTVLIKKSKRLNIGEFYDVLITDADCYDLKGQLL